MGSHVSFDFVNKPCSSKYSTPHLWRLCASTIWGMQSAAYIPRTRHNSSQLQRSSTCEGSSHLPRHEALGHRMMGRSNIIFFPTGFSEIPQSKFHGTNMGPIWGRQDPDEPHVGLMNLAIRDWRMISLVGENGGRLAFVIKCALESTDDTECPKNYAPAWRFIVLWIAALSISLSS